MPFREARPLSPREQRRVVAVWSVAGACFACLWAGALMLLLPSFSGLTALLAAAVLALLGSLFFGLVARILTTLVNRSFAAAMAPEVARRSEESGLAGDGQPLPLDPQ